MLPSTKQQATVSTRRLLAQKKSTPKMGKVTPVRMNRHWKVRLEKRSCRVVSPQQLMAAPLGPTRQGPHVWALDWCGTRLNDTLVSTKQCLPVNWSVMGTSIPGATALSCAGVISFPSRCKFSCTGEKFSHTSSGSS